MQGARHKVASDSASGGKVLAPACQGPLGARSHLNCELMPGGCRLEVLQQGLAAASQQVGRKLVAEPATHRTALLTSLKQGHGKRVLAPLRPSLAW